MEIHINKESDVPVRQQLAEQIVFSIATEELKPGDALPSVRELARRLKIHYNTVSEAYQDLVRRAWLVGRRGSRVVVRAPGKISAWAKERDLDDFINATIRLGRQQGHSLQALRERVLARLLAEPPDHLLIVEEEIGLRRLLQAEIQAALGRSTEACSYSELVANPSRTIGALTVAAQYAIAEVDRLVPKGLPAIPLAFSGADEHIQLLRKLQKPSIIAVVSVSEVFLKTAQSLLAPALGRRHVLQGFQLPLQEAHALRACDLVFADSLARSQVRHSTIVHYRMVAPSSLEYLSTAMKSYETVGTQNLTNGPKTAK